MRHSGRAWDEMRKVAFDPSYSRQTGGACLVRFGNTHLPGAASPEDRAPPFLRGGLGGL